MPIVVGSRAPKRKRPGIAQGAPGVQPPVGPLSQVQAGNPPSAPLQAGANLQPFGPDQNLIGTQIGPGQSQPLSQLNQTIGGQLQNLSGFQPGQDVGQAREGISGALANLQGPDRGALAQQTFEQIRESTQPQFEQELQGVGRRAAALGRIGAGMTTSQLGDVQSRREEGLRQAQQQLSTQAAGQSLADRLGILGATQGAAGALQGMDLNQLGAQRGILGTLLGAQGQRFGQEAQGRGELRGERGFQRGLAREAQQDKISRAMLEDQLTGSGFGRQMALANLLGGVSFGGGLGAGESQFADILNQRSGQTIGSLADLMRFRQQPNRGY